MNGWMGNRIAPRASFALLMAAVLALVGAAAAQAAEVVAMRVGDHPTFTRVVFELDAPAGYRIERGAASGKDEILITLDAASEPRSVDRRAVMIERVALQHGRDASVAHIRLRRQPSRVKELILSNPPRLVFDLVYPEAMLAARRSEQAAAKKAAAEPKPKHEAQPAPEEPPVVTRAVAPKPEPKPAPKVAKALPKPEPKAAPAAKAKVAPIAEPQTAKAPAPAPAVEPEASDTVPGKLAAAQADAAHPPTTGGRRTGRPSPRPAWAEPKTAEEPPAAKPAPRPEARPAPKRAATAKSEPAAEAKQPEPASVSADTGWRLWAGIAGGGVACLLFVALWMRRRSLPNDVETTDDDAGNDRGVPSSGFSMDALSYEDDEEEDAFGASEVEAPAARDATEIAAGPGLFEDDAEKENETMDLESPDLPMERTASEMPTQMNVEAPAAGAGASADIARLVGEMERRVAQLEARLDESNDARERLERQVAAQAEELRVQRAAIARTQRALRGLSRGGEEQATEPALREPSA